MLPCIILNMFSVPHVPFGKEEYIIDWKRSGYVENFPLLT